MRNILSGARGMAPLVLVILIAWALLSVMFLTGTLLAARSIDRSVNRAVTGINPTVERIGKNGANIAQAKTIAETSGKILTAAKPLSAQLDVIEATAKKGILPKLNSVLGKVGQINEVAGSINANVLQIGSTVDSILGNATSINSDVVSINHFGGRILASARSINSSVHLIQGDAGNILSKVNVIGGKVVTINGQAKTIDEVAKPILTDFHGILATVGRAGTDKTAGTIVFHTNEIDCGTLVNNPAGLGPSVLGPLVTLLTSLGLAPPSAQASLACVR